MKKCPNCSLIFADADDFCVADGGALVTVYDNVSRDIPTQVVSRPVASSAEAAGNNSSKVLYGIIGGLVALVMAMGATFFFVLNSQRETTREASAPANEKSAVSPLSAAQTSSTNTSSTNTNAPPAANVASQPAINKATPAMPAPRLDISPRGRWSGDWSAPSGAYLTINVDLSEDGSNRVSGQIEWTLRRTTRPEKMSKIGMKAIEYVSGQYDPVTRLVTLKGTSKDDPYGVLVMTDDYRLSLSEDSRRLNGAAKNGGKWNGKVNLSR